MRDLEQRVKRLQAHMDAEAPAPAAEAPDLVAWIDERLHRNELGQPFRLMDHQRVILRVAFAFDADGRLPWDTIIYSHDLEGYCQKQRERAG